MSERGYEREGERREGTMAQFLASHKDNMRPNYAHVLNPPSNESAPSSTIFISDDLGRHRQFGESSWACC